MTIQRLRELVGIGANDWRGLDVPGALTWAADEIDRLRAENELLKTELNVAIRAAEVAAGIDALTRHVQPEQEKPGRTWDPVLNDWAPAADPRRPPIIGRFTADRHPEQEPSPEACGGLSGVAMPGQEPACAACAHYDVPDCPGCDEQEPADAALPCGHDPSAIVSSDEGTHYCGACRAEALRRRCGTCLHNRDWICTGPSYGGELIDEHDGCDDWTPRKDGG